MAKVAARCSAAAGIGRAEIPQTAGVTTWHGNARLLHCLWMNAVIGLAGRVLLAARDQYARQDAAE